MIVAQILRIWDVATGGSEFAVLALRDEIRGYFPTIWG